MARRRGAVPARGPVGSFRADGLRLRGGRTPLWTAGLLLSAAVWLLVVPAAGAPLALGSPAAVTCNPKNASPSALDIPGVGPKHLAAGAILNVTFEYLVANYSKADRGVALDFPSATAVFPTLPTGSVKLFFPAKNVSVLSSKWSDPSVWRASTTVATATTFNSNASAYLTTSKIAIMAGLPTGSLTLKVRWQWTIFNPVTGLHSMGAWTVPSLSAKSPFLPSTFYPASFVGLVSTSGSPVPSGSTYVLGLNGTVASTWFRLVLEYPNNGTEIQSIYENTTATNLVFNATLPVAYRNGTGVPAGHYLMHVHDSCQAIVHSISVAVS